MGRAIAVALAVAGAEVVLVARRAAALAEAVDEIVAAGGRAHALAADLSSRAEARGVCCNAVSPGFVRTPLTEPLFAVPGRADALAARTMVGRNGTADDITGLVVFLAGPSAAYVTGQLIFCDGGFSVH